MTSIEEEPRLRAAREETEAKEAEHQRCLARLHEAEEALEALKFDLSYELTERADARKDLDEAKKRVAERAEELELAELIVNRAAANEEAVGATVRQEIDSTLWDATVRAVKELDAALSLAMEKQARVTQIFLSRERLLGRTQTDFRFPPLTAYNSGADSKVKFWRDFVRQSGIDLQG